MNDNKVGIYIAQDLYSGNNEAVQFLKTSGFSSVTACHLHVDPMGDLTYNDCLIISGSSYIGDVGWPNRIGELKKNSTVERVTFSLGGYRSNDFYSIKKLIQSQGTGPGSVLYNNFRTLKSMIPHIDAIEIDDEDLYDRQTIVDFTRMLHGLGYEVTFSIYGAASFWIDTLYELHYETPGIVSGFQLQCYSGGAGNNPGGWIKAIEERMGSGFDARSFVKPGLRTRHGKHCLEGQCPERVGQQFTYWRSLQLTGGWIYLYDDIRRCESSSTCTRGMCLSKYADAIIDNVESAPVAAMHDSVEALKSLI